MNFDLYKTTISSMWLCGVVPLLALLTIMLKLMLIFLSFVMFSSCLALLDTSYDDLWMAYQIKFKKFYGKEHEVERRKIWEQNVPMIAKHNLEADMGLHSFRLGLNKFTDMTTKELDVYRKCLSHQKSSRLIKNEHFKCDDNCLRSLPKYVDWSKKGFVTPVKDQKDCGSCWAFSATGALEGQNKAKTGRLVSLSEQNFVDCSWKQGNQGCDGGWMDYAFQYVIDNNGTDTEAAYPYTAVDGLCKFNRSGVGAKCKSFVSIQEGKEKFLQAAVALIGPISVAIDASGKKFMSYMDGIYYDKTCTTQELDHAVLVVGYGTMNGTDYWIVKNSWGAQWGKNGYIWMRRNAHNMCGIATHAVYPVV